ncbi:unnamed protein product [Ectocarpus fasciculatus]
MEGRVAALHAQGDTREALMVARETVSALKLALIRTEGEVELHAQLLYPPVSVRSSTLPPLSSCLDTNNLILPRPPLSSAFISYGSPSLLQRDEKLRSVASLSRAEDLQGKVDRMAVEKTLDGVAGGTVSALALIDRFAGTLYRQSRRVKDMEEQVGTMRIRCARLARLARGDTADGGSPSGAAAAPTVASGAGRSDAPGRLRSEERRAEDECWVAAGVQEAAAAMEAGRRRSLEQEVESLRNEVLAERRRADAAQLEARDERRLRSLAAPAGGGVGSSSSQDYTINCTNKGEEAALRRKLELAAGEIEALRTHTRDLRSQVQSGWWSWRPSSSEAGGGGEPLSGGGGGVEEEQEFGFLEGLVSSGAACAAAEAALREVRTTGGGGGGGDDSNVSIEVDRLTSLLSEKDAQIGVLTSTVEALQTSPAFAPPSPRKGGVAAAPGANVDGAAVASSPRLRTDRETARTPTSRGSSRVSSFWAADVSGNGVDDGGGGGVGVLNLVGAQGLARRCVALTVRLTSALAREGRAERRAERLTAEAGRRDRKIRAAARAEEDLARRNRALENAARKTAAALSSLRAESAARLRGAGEEASQLRRALRDAELGGDDACQRLASSRAECHALAVELRENRQQHREEVLRLSEAHDARIKECADRLSLDGASPLPQPPLGGHGTRGRRRGATATVAASVASSPVAAAIAELAAQWRAFVSNGMGDDYENDGNNKNRRRRRQRTSASADVPGPSGGGYRPGNKTAVPSGGGGGSKGTVISERQFTATATFLQETAVRLDTECSRAVRRARALEWELAGARRGQLDAATALEEAREEVCRLSARAAVAEASVTAAVLPAGKPSYAGHLAESSSSSAMPRSGGSGGVRFGGDGAGEGTSAGTGRWSYYTVAAVSLLEKRFAAAVEDLVAAEAAGAAAVAGEAAANARADAAEAAARESLTRADLLASDLERHKVSATDGAAADGAAAEWRREIRAELGRWWKDDLLALHSGVVLDWGSAGAADAAAAALTRKNKKMPADGIGGGGGGDGFTSGSRYSANPGGEGGHATASAEGIEHGVSGEEAMAQALIAGREEQAHLEDRLQLSERRVGKLRGETLRLRATLERWHTEFVAPALQEAQKCRRRLPPPGDAGGAALEAPQRRPTAAATVAVVDGKGVLERKLLEATAGLLGVREEATGLRREVASLRFLVARLREDENDARETAGRRVESARDASRRRADGDLKDAAERLEEERERFKAQLGAAHAEILRLGAEAAESERRRSFDKERRNREANAARLGYTGEHGGVGDSGPSGEGSIIVDDGGVGSRSGGGGGGGVILEEVTGVPTGGRKRPAEGSGREGGGARGEASERERALRREVEGEREALRRMCNGLAVDLKEAVEARSEAKDEREALVQEAARAKAEAKLAGLARENLEAALKELGRLLEFARETAGATRDAPVGLGDDEDRPLHAASLSGWDRPKVEAQRFARVMVAAKVAEADLLRRLRGAASAEAELRHLIRRRDIRIEELKRDLATSDRLGRSMSGGSGSGSNRHHHQRLSLRESGSTSSPGNVSGATAAAATDTAARGSQAKAMASERAAKEVALNAALKHLELELAEASARGEVGDAVTRAAERFVLRLFPEAENSGGGVGGAWSGKGHCRACGLTPERARRPAVNLADSGRGALFLVPSADVERKAALAASSAALDAVAEAQPETPAAAAGSSSVSANNDAGAVETFPARSPARTPSADTPTRTAGEGGRRNRVSPPSAIDALGFSSGVQSLEANLARLEAVVAGNGPAGVAKSTDVGPEGLGGIRSSSAPGGTAVEVAWAEAVRGLREQVLDLGHRAEVTEELLEEERAAKGNLDEEVLRLRTELLRQQRSYWQATAKLKQRYEHTLHADNEQEGNEEDGPVPLGVAAAAGSDETAVSSRARETPPDEDEEGTAATRARAQQQKEEQQQRQQHRSPRADIEERLRDRERELREVRGLHAREAKDVAAELARVVEAHRARVAILEEKLRRTTRKIKAMARPKPKTAAKRGRESVRGGGGDAGGYHCAFSSSTPLSTDELLNLLAAADEEVFEARSRTQRLEFELRAKTAEADAVSLLRDERGGVAAANPVSTERVVIEGEGNGQVSALAISPSCVAPAAETAAEGTGKATGLASVAFAARLAAAEAEVATLRQEGLAARELALGAQRESAALKLAAHRRTADRADENRCREKELRRQVSAYKREAERLRSTATAAAALAPTAEKNGGPRKAGGGGASAAAAAAAGGDAKTATLKLRAQQLGAIREESERRGRTIVALRAVKAALGEDVQRLRQEAAGQEEKLARALKDAGVKSNTAKALRDKVAALEAEIAALKSTRTKANVTTVAGRVVSAEARGGSLPATDAVTAGSPGDAVGAALEPPAPICDVQTATVRDLRAERDRLRASMRGWHGSLSKKTAEIDAQVAELQRLEAEAGTLRATVARKDDAYRATKKQLLSVREEYEQFKDSSHRWRADAEAKWRGLRRASEAAVRRAKDSEKSGDAAELEFAALKSAFRSFLKTLWDDLRSRPPVAPPTTSVAADACPAVPEVVTGHAGRTGNDSSVGQHVSGAGSTSGDGRSGKGAKSWTRKEGDASAAPTSTGLFPVDAAERHEQGESGQEMFAGLAKATVAIAAAREDGGVEVSPIERGGGGGGPFGELTEAEVSDIMQALSLSDDQGGSRLLLSSSSSPSSSSSSSSSSLYRNLPVAGAEPTRAGTAPLTSHQQQQQQQQRRRLRMGVLKAQRRQPLRVRSGTGTWRREVSLTGAESLERRRSLTPSTKARYSKGRQHSRRGWSRRWGGQTRQQLLRKCFARCALRVCRRRWPTSLWTTTLFSGQRRLLRGKSQRHCRGHGRNLPPTPLPPRGIRLLREAEVLVTLLSSCRRRATEYLVILGDRSCWAVAGAAPGGLSVLWTKYRRRARRRRSRGSAA